MATGNSTSEAAPQKRQRRSKQDSQFIFENTTVDRALNLTKPKIKPIQPINEHTIPADIYQPGDVVWSKLGSFPWWPALIYRCDAEGGIYTKTFNSNSKSTRQYFVYFYGKYLEYAWLSTRSLLKFAGLDDFIQNAETAVQAASTKSQKLELANRYQLKVSMKKRVQWDEAIELADHALTLTKDERIKEFKDLLSDVPDNNTKQSKNSLRRRKISIDRKHDEAIPNKRRARVSLSSSFTSEQPQEEKPSQASTSFQIENNNKKKRGRKPKPKLQINENHKDETEYEYPSLSNGQITSAPIMHCIQANIPPLSNYEQKQIVEGLLHHSNEKNLTFDEAHKFAMEKAIEIVYENYHYRMNNISSEWFYDSILLKYPSIIFKYRSWFNDIKSDIIPNETDVIQLKQWQIVLMIQAQIKAEQQQQQVLNNT
ncbi:unnamed protein product [Adineta steineri]|uniref:PWWP domain-containing protein n=2 Tax=Adineta steineri TaxID=433720 RepID=A0A815U6E8_9BILA|nr:unnamed protein product [Adineta steineri]